MLTLPVNDFILVLTHDGEVLTVPLHQIERVQTHPIHPSCAVLLLHAEGCVLVLQETAEAFLNRAQRFHEALKNHDLSGINHHLAPDVA